MRNLVLLLVIAVGRVEFMFSPGYNTIELIREGDYKINVLVDGQLFTSYLFDPDQRKLIFFPIK